MKKPESVSALDDLGRVRLSQSFFMREFLYSEVANFHGIPNLPDDPDLAVSVGKRLCEDLLEPLQATFGKVVIRSAYRSCEVNGFCNQQQREKKKGYTCASNEANFAGHIWDRRDADGYAGATACIVIPWFADRYENGADWRGGSMIICPTRACISSRSWRHSTFPGTKNPHGGSTVISIRKVALPSLECRTTRAITPSGTQVSKKLLRCPIK